MIESLKHHKKYNLGILENQIIAEETNWSILSLKK